MNPRVANKARGGDPFLGATDPDAVIMHRALGTAIEKAKFGVELNAREDLACSIIAGALDLNDAETFEKARHSARHPDGSGRFAPANPKIAAPEADDVIDAGAQAATTRPITLPSIWKHGGASLLG